MESPTITSFGIPTSYLEAYPFPAFVLVIPLPQNKRPALISRDTDVTVRGHEDVSPLSMPTSTRTQTPRMVWSNEKWMTVSEGRSLEDCVDPSLSDRLYDWAENDGQPTPGHPNGESVFTLPLLGSNILRLAKTTIPLSPPSSSHVFCIITSQSTPAPKYPKRTNSNSTVSPAPLSSASSDTTTTSYFDHQRASLDSSSTEPVSATSSDERDSRDADHNGAWKAAEVSADMRGKIRSQGKDNMSVTSSERRKRRQGRWRPRSADALSFQVLRTHAEECWALVHSIDWSKTSLGPRSTWATLIDPLLSIVFESRSQDCLWLGDELFMFYNMNYANVLPEPGHPYTFGKKGREVWAVLHDFLGPFLDAGLRGESTFRENDLVMYDRLPNGELCERYFSWRYNPVRNSEGKVIAIYNQAVDVTDTVIAERRLGTVRDLSEHLLVARSTREYYDSLAQVFDYNQKEAPFMLAYSVKVKNDTPLNISTELRLESTLGVPEGHPSAPPTISIILSSRSRANFGPNADKLSSPTLSAISVLSSEGSGHINHVNGVTSWPIGKALQTRQPVVVDDCRELIRGYPDRAWDMLPMSAIVLPICSDSSTDVPDGVLILGLNVRRPYDAEYDGWIHVVRSQLTNSLTAVKAAEEETNRRAENDRMERAKAAWFRGAAHDLRSPLTLVAGPLEDVLGSTLNHNQRSALTTAKRNVDRLLRLVNTLMDFSRVEAGRVEGRFVPIDLGTFVSEIAAIFRPAIERLKLAFNVDIQPIPRLVYIDPTLFETVLSNLIGNAIKYTESGSITVKLTFDDNNAQISIIDTGIGIPRDEVSSVAEWYHRATTALHAGTQGSGLGLALAREFIHLHGGELHVTSKFGPECNGDHGSTFTAQIPLIDRLTTELSPSLKLGTYGAQVANEAMRWVKPTDSDTDSNHSGSTTDNYTNSTTTVNSEGSGLLFESTDMVLLVEDSIDMRNYIKHLFTPYCMVIEARNGEEGLALAKKHRPNIILSDLMMPKLNGMDMLRAIRAEDDLKFIPFILTSAVAGEEVKVDALLAGAEDYIPKPFKPKELLARVHLQLQLGKKRVKLEKAYAQQVAEIAVLSDYCPTGIMRANIEGRLIYGNNAWREMAGMDADTDPDRWPEFCEASTQEYLWPLWTDWLASNQKELTASWKWLTGRKVQARFIRLDRVVEGMAPSVLGCLTDVTYEEERLAEAEARRAEAEESKHQQELLIDLTSHEIRTPVSAILQCSSLVKENLVSLFDSLKLAAVVNTGFRPSHELLADLEEDIEALESIYQCGLVQERIAGDILSLARIQLDMLSLHDIGMDVRREAHKVLSVFASEAKMKRIELALEFGETLDIAKVAGIKTDPVRLGQVVTNLISNAIRFTAASDVRKITVRYEVSFAPPADNTCALPGSIALPPNVPAPEDTDLWLFVSVRDTGPGLGPKELALLFKRFSQGNKMIHTRYGGSGLGLFICRKITELLGGRIEVQSQLGDGSVFRFFIKTCTVAPPVRAALSEGALAQHDAEVSTPMDPSAPSLDRSMSSITTNSSQFKSTGTPPPEEVKNLHILIVEDNIINQTVLKRQIIKAGLTCDVANNGLEALNLVRETDRSVKRGGPKARKRYDAVLMDLEMPVMDGLTAIRQIRASEKAGSLARNMVIALTGNARQGQIDQALEAGMDDVVIKPYVLSNLLKKIKAITAKRLELDIGNALKDM